MKKFIVGLLGFVALTACATTAKTKIPTLPPASQGFCTANNGIFVILVNDMGEKVEFACPTIRGKRITQPSERSPDATEPGRITNLGKIQKFKAKDDPDPCVTWTSGGVKRHFCW